jgi:hypothetical protein
MIVGGALTWEADHPLLSFALQLLALVAASIVLWDKVRD